MARGLILLFASSISTLAWSLPALAQTEEPRSPAIGQDGSGEIIVTARRREESLQDVPIAVTALTGEELVRKGVTSVDDLKNVTPGLNIGGLARDDAFFFLRGQGPGPAGTARSAPGVATYFAEVPTFLAGSGTMYDLESVQVLKGPQGTLFGRSTTGGAVLFEPHRPTSEAGGYAKLTIGNHSYYEFEGVVNAPIKPDAIELRIASQISRRQGFTQSIITSQKLDDRNFESFRASLLLKPTDRLENLTIVDYRAQDGSGSSQVLYGINPGSVLGAPIFGAPLRAGGIVSVACLQVALPGCPPGGAFGAIGVALNGGNTSDPATSGFYVVAPTSQFEEVYATQQAIGPRKVQVPFLTRKARLDVGITNKTIFELTDSIKLKNIFGYRYSRTNQSLDYDGTPLNVISQDYVTSQEWGSGYEQITDEFQIQGALDSLNLNYTLGYYHEDSKPGFTQMSSGVTLGAFSNTLRDYRDKSDAIFGHLEWNPAEFLGLSGGIRKTWDKRTQTLSRYDAAGNCNLPDQSTGLITCPISYHAKFSAVTYDITASFKPTSNILAYATYRKGYKTGGFNLPAPRAPGNDPGAYQTFKPETLMSYEAGVKADWNIGFPVRTNISAFYNDYKNIQTGIGAVTENGDAVQVILNVSKARQKGFEFETSMQPFRLLQLSGFVSYLESYPLENLFGAAGEPVVIKGLQSSNSPKWKYGVSGSLVLPTSSDVGQVRISADWSWQSKRRQPNLVTNNPYYPSYGLLNGRIEWNEVLGSRFDIAVFANNLLDKTYIFGGYPLGNIGTEAAIYGEPRMYGLSAKVRF